jgi:hypothetical protein
MLNSVDIRGQGARVTIVVLGYERPNASNSHDANWLRCRVRLAVGEFSAELEAAFTTYDFVEFESQLHKAFSAVGGKARFLTDERSLKLEIEFKKTGQVTVSGLAQTFGSPRAGLSFSFESDQTFLGQTDDELKAIIRSFPVRQVGTIV